MTVGSLMTSSFAGRWLYRGIRAKMSCGNMHTSQQTLCVAHVRCTTCIACLLSKQYVMTDQGWTGLQETGLLALSAATAAAACGKCKAPCTHQGASGSPAVRRKGQQFRPSVAALLADGYWVAPFHPSDVMQWSTVQLAAQCTAVTQQLLADAGLALLWNLPVAAVYTRRWGS